MTTTVRPTMVGQQHKKSGGGGLPTTTTSTTTNNKNKSEVAAKSKTSTKTTKHHSSQQSLSKKKIDSVLMQRMTVDKKIVDEILLVCGVIGTTTTTTDNGGGEEIVVPVEDCVVWLQDLQRCLRRDDDNYRPISLLFAQWNIVATKLLPLVLHSKYDTDIVITICKILVILTKPLSVNTIHAGCMIIDTKSGKYSEGVIQEQIVLRNNALQQAAALMEYKRMICYHPSHHHHNQRTSSSGGGGGGGILSIFVSLLAEPLSRTGNARTDRDHLIIELVLNLFRNLLAAEPFIQTTPAERDENRSLHYELITLLEKELVIDVLLVIAADIERRENAPYNLLLMELLHLLFRHQDPIQTAQSSCLSPTIPGTNNAASSIHRISGNTSTANRSKENTSNAGATGTTGNSTIGTSKTSQPLLGQLKREKQALAANATSRHSHFGGTWLIESGRQKGMVNAALLGRTPSTFNSSNNAMVGGSFTATARRRKSKHSEPFIGAPPITRDGCHPTYTSPAAMRAARTLHTFCQRFVTTGYGPVMKSLKNEFRRDSVRLEKGDRVVFFQLIHFLCQWWRTARANGSLLASPSVPASGNDDTVTSGIGQLIFTMDVFTFNLVLMACDTFLEKKQYGPLAHSVALLGEMLHLLQIMYTSAESPTERIMAMGLMDRLFYDSEPLDRLPKLLSRWTEGTSTRQYLCNLIGVCHTTMELLDTSAAACSQTEQSSTLHNNSNTITDVAIQNDVTVAKMKAAVAEFDVGSYFARKIASNHFVTMMTHLLSQYSINALDVNDRIISLLQRLAQHTVSMGDDETTSSRNPLAAKKVTLEPMLFNIPFLVVLNTILNDTVLSKDAEYTRLRQFAASTVTNFAVAAEANPMLFVEAMFKHPFPHRYCELVTNSYVTDDLRMLAERDWILQQQQQLEASSMTKDLVNTNANNNDVDVESEDEELEFTDDIPAAPLTKAFRAKRRSVHSGPPPGSKDTGSENQTDGGDDDDEIGEVSRKHDTQQLDDEKSDDDGGGGEDTDDEGTKDKAAVDQRKQKADKSAQLTLHLKKRIRALDDDELSDEDDDDDNLFNSTTTTTTVPPREEKPMDVTTNHKKSRRSTIFDSDDDEN